MIVSTSEDHHTIPHVSHPAYTHSFKSINSTNTPKGFETQPFLDLLPTASVYLSFYLLRHKGLQKSAQSTDLPSIWTYLSCSSLKHGPLRGRANWIIPEFPKPLGTVNWNFVIMHQAQPYKGISSSSHEPYHILISNSSSSNEHNL